MAAVPGNAAAASCRRALAVVASVDRLGHRPFARRASLGPGDLVAVPDLLDAVRDVARAGRALLAIGIVFAVHALNNLGPALLLLARRLGAVVALRVTRCPYEDHDLNLPNPAAARHRRFPQPHRPVVRRPRQIGRRARSGDGRGQGIVPRRPARSQRGRSRPRRALRPRRRRHRDAIAEAARRHRARAGRGRSPRQADRIWSRATGISRPWSRTSPRRKRPSPRRRR